MAPKVVEEGTHIVPSGAAVAPAVDLPPVTTGVDINLLQLYVSGLYRHTWPNSPYRHAPFDFASAQTVLPYMRFDHSLKLQARLLTRDDYLTLLHQSNPALAEVLEKTDFRDDLPETNINLHNLAEIVSQLPIPLELEQERTAQAAQNLRECSEYLFVIENVGVLSLFMRTGKLFRDYVQATASLAAGPLFLLGQIKEGNNWQEKKVTGFPKTKELFKTQNIATYLRSTRKTELTGMIDEYEELRNLDSRTAWYTKLRAANPAFTI